jgi:hypothetical protein
MTTFIAFDGDTRIATGALPAVVERCKTLLATRPDAAPIVYDDSTGRPVDIDYRGTTHDVLARLPGNAPPAKRGPGRPRLGVVAREVTLLPRHWDWLASQPGGASVALRRLVEVASRERGAADRQRQAAEAVDRIMMALAGNLPDYEEASRAFHRHDGERFALLTEQWPVDIRDYVRLLAVRAGGDV